MTPSASPATLVTTPSDREIVITRVVSAPRSLVFEVYTSPAHLPNWMLGPDGWSMPICEIDLRVGGAWRFVWRRADGAELEMRGIYREIAPPERLVSSEPWRDGLETINTLLLSERDGKTTIVNRLLYPSREARDEMLKTGMQEGVARGFERLDAYLASMASSRKQ